MDSTARIVDSIGNELSSLPTKKSFPRGVEICPIDASTFQRSSDNSCSSNSLIRDFKNFSRSGAPSRFLFFRDGSWTDFPRHVFDILTPGFIAGKAILDASIGYRTYIFDFLRLIQIDAATGVSNSIAWIDVNGRCFFPRMVLDGQRNIAPCRKLEIEIRIDRGSSITPSSDCNKLLKRKRDELEPLIREYSNESPETSSTASLGRPRWSGVVVVGDGDRYCKLVEKLFLDGMRRFAPDTVITSIHKCSHSSRSGNSRLKAFQTWIQMTKANRGDGGVKFGWYATSARDVAAVVSHGFGRPNGQLFGSGAYGVGIHLSPPHSPYASSLLAEEDGNGERHIILCRAIMGKSEKVEAGSLQFHPSSEEFDSGVDDLANPKWYIVWSTHMNSHILPEYVVSFKSSMHSQDPHTMMSPSKKPCLTSLSFPKLFAEMGGSLPSSRKQNLEILYNHYKAGKIRRDTFIKQLRSTVGDKTLASTIRRLRGN